MSTTSRHRWTIPVSLALLLVIVALVAACGGSDDAGETAAAPATETQAAEPTTAAETGAETGAAAPATDKIALEPKTIGIMGPTDSAEIIKLGTDAADEAAKALGWETIRVDPQGDPAKMASGMTSLVNSNVDAIVLVTIEPSVIQAGLQAAADAGIPVINTLTLTESSPLFAGEYFVDPEAENQILADRMAQDVPDGSQIGAIYLPQFLNAKIAGDLIKETAPEQGWEIVAGHDADLTNLVPDTRKAVGDMLRANPDIDAIWGCCDFVPPGAVPALEAAGGDLSVYALHGIPSVMPFVESGRAIVEVADYQKGSIVAIDQLANHWAAGAEISKEMPSEYAFEMTIVDSSNA